MPIFSKDGERVYFAHIPKTAGSAIYLLFLSHGWSIANVDTGLGRKRIGHRIWKEHGVKEIPMEGDRQGFKRSIQHAPHEVWQTWGPFTSSFAVVRHPHDRCASALRYFYRMRRRDNDYDTVKAGKIKALTREFAAAPDLVEPLFQPQVRFVAPDTQVLRYEDDWPAQLAALYGLDAGALEQVNVSKDGDTGLSAEEIAWVNATYADDFTQLGYQMGGTS